MQQQQVKQDRKERTSICSICQSKVATGSLKRHQRTSKRCIANSNKNMEEVMLRCEGCSYKSPVKQNVDRHVQTCTAQRDREITKLREEIERIRAENASKHQDILIKMEELKQENSFLKGQIVGMQSSKVEVQSGASTSRRKKNLDGDNELPKIPMTRQHIIDNVDLYTFEMYQNGVKGLAMFFQLLLGDNDSGSQRNYKCNDSSRMKFSRFTEEGEWKDDLNGAFILHNLYDGMKDSGVFEKHYEQIMKESNCQKRDYLLERAKPILYAIDNKCSDAARKEALHKQFMKELMSVLLTKE